MPPPFSSSLWQEFIFSLHCLLLFKFMKATMFSTEISTGIGVIRHRCQNKKFTSSEIPRSLFNFALCRGNFLSLKCEHFPQASIRLILLANELVNWFWWNFRKRKQWCEKREKWWKVTIFNEMKTVSSFSAPVPYCRFYIQSAIWFSKSLRNTKNLPCKLNCHLIWAQSSSKWRR